MERFKDFGSIPFTIFGAASEPVSTLELVLCISAAKELAVGQEKARVAPTLHWSRTKNRLHQGLKTKDRLRPLRTAI